MAVNNETGAIFPVEAAAAAIKRAGAPALLHVDAVQAFGKLPLRPAKMGIDLMSISGHKIHAPKGIGALYIGNGVHLVPRVFGGGQEQNIRPGTESVPLIGALGAAVEALPSVAQEEAAMRALNRSLREKMAAFPDVVIHSPEDGLPCILSFSAGTGPRRNNAAFSGFARNLCVVRLGLRQIGAQPCAHGHGTASKRNRQCASREFFPL